MILPGKKKETSFASEVSSDNDGLDDMRKGVPVAMSAEDFSKDLRSASNNLAKKMAAFNAVKMDSFGYLGGDLIKLTETPYHGEKNLLTLHDFVKYVMTHSDHGLKYLNRFFKNKRLTSGFTEIRALPYQGTKFLLLEATPQH